MEAVLVHLAEDVEEEGIHIVVQRLVVQKQLREEAQILHLQMDNCVRTTIVSQMVKHLRKAIVRVPRWKPFVLLPADWLVYS